MLINIERTAFLEVNSLQKYKKLFFSTFKLSASTFGGGFVIISLMRKKFVEKLGWIEEDDRGNYDSWEENYTFAVTSGSPASRLDSYDKYNGEVSESMTSKEKSFTLVVDGVTVCSNEPISNVGKVDKVIGNYRYIF